MKAIQSSNSTTQPQQIQVRVKAAGFCGTDLMAFNNEFGSELLFIGRHEPAGIVEEGGSDVTRFKVRDQVGCIVTESVCGMVSS